MIISVSDPALGGAPEWVLLELQGKLASTSGSSFDGSFMGFLKVADKRLLLQVGNHNIVGSFQPLDKAFHVLQRRQLQQPSEQLGSAAEEQEQGVEYIVRCVVRRKLVFTSRPQPVITAALGGGGGGPGRP